MKGILLSNLTFIFVFATLPCMEEKKPTAQSSHFEAFKILRERALKQKAEEEKLIQSSSLPPHLQGAEQRIERKISELRQLFEQFDGTNTDQLSQTIHENLDSIKSPVIVDEVKKRFVEQYAEELSFNPLIEIIENGENRVILFDQRTITFKKEKGQPVKYYSEPSSPQEEKKEQPTSPWKDYSFEKLLTAYSLQKERVKHFTEHGRDHGPSWPNAPELLKKEEKRRSWSGLFKHH